MSSSQLRYVTIGPEQPPPTGTGDYNFSFEVPFYTSVAGVGLGPNEVTVRSFRVPCLGGPSQREGV